MQGNPQIVFSPTRHFYEVRNQLNPFQIIQNNGKKAISFPSQIKIAKYVTSVKEAFFPGNKENVSKEAFLKANVILCFIGIFESLMCVRTNKKLSQLFCKALMQVHEKWDEHIFYTLAFIQKDENITRIATNFLEALKNRNNPQSLLEFESSLLSDLTLLDSLYQMFSLIISSSSEEQVVYDLCPYLKNIQQINFDENFYRIFQNDFAKIFSMRIPILYYLGDDIKILECPFTIDNTIKSRFCLIVPTHSNPPLSNTVFIGYDKKSTLLLFREKIFKLYKDPYSKKNVNLNMNQEFEFCEYFVKKNTLNENQFPIVEGLSKTLDQSNNRKDDNTDPVLENSDIIDAPEIYGLDSGVASSLEVISEGIQRSYLNISELKNLLSRLLFTEQKVIFPDKVMNLINYLLGLVETYRLPKLKNPLAFTLESDPNSQLIQIQEIQARIQHSGQQFNAPQFGVPDVKKNTGHGGNIPSKALKQGVNPIFDPRPRNANDLNPTAPVGYVEDTFVNNGQDPYQAMNLQGHGAANMMNQGAHPGQNPLPSWSNTIANQGANNFGGFIPQQNQFAGNRPNFRGKKE